MSDPHTEPSTDPVLSRRLARLRTMPVETASIDRRLSAAIPAIAASDPRQRSLFTPLRALAASLLVATGLTLSILAVSSSEVVASPEQLAGVYRAAVAGDVHTQTVRTIGDARAALQRLWPGTPVVPDLPEQRLMSCCVHRIGRQRLSCMTFELDGSPVTLALAPEADVSLPAPAARQPDGTAVVVSESNGVRMVMTERDGLWMCLMGTLPADRLEATLAAIRGPGGGG